MESNFLSVSPTRLFLFMLSVIFVVEVIIMVVLPWEMGPNRPVIVEMILDSSLLTLAVSPILWWVRILPLRRLIKARTELLAKVIDAQEEERERISRELHDGVGQALTSLRVGLKAAETVEDLETLRTRCQELRAIAASTHEEVGRMARGLRPAVLHDLGLGAAMERLGQEMGDAHGLSVTLDIDHDAARLDPHTEIAIFRIAQEALTNITRHAQAKKVCVRMHRNGSWMELRVVDDGKGFDQSGVSEGLGLSGMRQRADLLGGTLSVESRAGEGTSVVARIPVAEVGHGEDANPAGG